MAKFELERRIPSCFIDLDLLGRIEGYVLEGIPTLLGVEPETVARKFRVSLKDDSGTEEVARVSQFPSRTLPDATKEVSVRLYLSEFVELESESRKGEWRDLSLWVTFSREPRSTKLVLSCTAPRAREIALGIADELGRRIEPSSTSNWVFHPSLGVETLLSFVLFMLPVPISLAFMRTPAYVAYPAAAAFVLLVLIRQVAPRLKPYSSFDSRSQQALDRLWSWFLWGLLTFVVFGSLFTALRNKLLGF